MPGTMFDLIHSIKKGCVRTEERIRADYDLSTAELVGLRILQTDEAILAGLFAERLELSPSRGSRVINQMVQKGLVTAHPIPENRRSVQVSLTTVGRRMQRSVELEILQCENRLLAQLPESQRDTFKSTLEMLSNLLNSDPSQP